MTEKTSREGKKEDKPSKAASTKKTNKVEAKEEQHAHKEAKPATNTKTAKKSPPSLQRHPLAPKTLFAKEGQLNSQWRIVDAKGQRLGRLSTQIATLLMGKDKPGYTRFTDTGDHIVVINAKDIVLTGKKWTDKVYHYHTNYPGGLKTITARELREKHPERLVKWAVYGMLPKGHMGRHWYKKLRVFSGAEHPHTAQQPKSLMASAERA